MVNTKTTPRKPMAESKVICPVCKKDIPEGQTFEQHVVGCAKTKVNQMSQCEICKTTFIKDEYRRRHMRREHGKEGKHSDWDSDPEVEVGDVVKDPCVPKRSLPQPVAAPPKVCRPSVVGKDTDAPRPVFKGTPLRRVAHVPKEKSSDSCTGGAKMFSDRDTQTDTGTDKAEIPACLFCNIQFGERLMLCMHQGIHAVDNPLRCNACGFLCADKLEFFSHITWGHGK